MCELCGGYVEVQHARIMTDGGDRFDGRLCTECRTGRELCIECDYVKPAHEANCEKGE